MTPRKLTVRLTIRDLTSPNDPAVAQAYTLLTRNFKAHERVRLREWKGALTERTAGFWSDYAWHLLVAELDGEVIGLATGTYLGNVNIGVIGYLAIDAAHRAAGAGTRLRRRLRQAFARDALRLSGASLQGIVGEVSATNPWIRTLSRRPRVLILNVAYFQPSLRPGDRPSPFLLYFETVTTPRHFLAASQLRQILFAVWRRAYRISRPLEHAAFRAMMASLAGRRRIGRHPQFPRS